MNQGLQIWALKQEITDSEERPVLSRYITRVSVKVRSTREPFKPVACKLWSQMERVRLKWGAKEITQTCQIVQLLTSMERGGLRLSYFVWDCWSHVFLQSEDMSLCHLRRRWLLFLFFELRILRSVKPWKTTCWISMTFFWVNNMKSLYCLKCRGKSVRSLFVFYLSNKLFFCVKDLAANIVPWALMTL